MTTYYWNQNNTESVGKFQGENILHPKYQCTNCGHAISPSYARNTGICGLCSNGYNNFEHLQRIFSVTIYTYDFTDHKITNSIDEVKKGKYAEEMADILEWGIRNLNSLSDYDVLMSPPRGTKEASLNHMNNIGELLSGRVGIPIHDMLKKSSEYGSQRDIDGAQERRENVDGKIGCVRDLRTSPSVIVLDDVATTGATLENCAKALNASGASKVAGLTIARTEYLERLVDAGVYIPEDE